MLVQADVDEALRLMRMSKVSLLETGPQREQKDPVSLIYEAIRDDAQRSGKQSYTWGDLSLLIGNKFSVRFAASSSLLGQEALPALIAVPHIRSLPCQSISLPSTKEVVGLCMLTACPHSDKQRKRTDRSSQA